MSCCLILVRVRQATADKNIFTTISAAMQGWMIDDKSI